MQEFEIIKRKIPDVQDSLGKQVVAFVQAIRQQDFYKLPGIAETIDWANALIKLGTTELSAEITSDTLGTLLKYQDDIEKMDNDTTHGLVQRAFAEANLISTSDKRDSYNLRRISDTFSIRSGLRQ